MDTNVIGRWKAKGLPEPDYPSVKRIVVLNLSDASGGNANGIGLADFTTQKLVKKNRLEDNTYKCPHHWILGSCLLPPSLLMTERQLHGHWRALNCHLKFLFRQYAYVILSSFRRVVVNSNGVKGKLINCEQIGTFRPLEYNEEGDSLPAG